MVELRAGNRARAVTAARPASRIIPTPRRRVADRQRGYGTMASYSVSAGSARHHDSHQRKDKRVELTNTRTEREHAAAGGTTPLTDVLVRDLVERYPATMAVLAPLGIDLCCGGGHRLGEALDAHGIAREPVLAQISGVVTREE